MSAPSFPVAYSSDNFVNYHGPAESLLPYQYAAQQPPAAREHAWPTTRNSTEILGSGVQTPPPAPSSELSSPQLRRTEVSIRDIVEDTVQQPPTPTSVNGGTKRKADALDEAVEEPAQEHVEPGSEAEASVVARDAQAVEAPAASTVGIDRRPKKRLRSRIGSVMKTAAAWTLPGVVVGAAASVAFLTSVPNDFFVA